MSQGPASATVSSDWSGRCWLLALQLSARCWPTWLGPGKHVFIYSLCPLSAYQVLQVQPSTQPVPNCRQLAGQRGRQRGNAPLPH